MTFSQLSAKSGIQPKQWVTLEGICNMLLFSPNEGNLLVSPRSIQFYFDNTNDLVFVRRTDDKLYKNKINSDMVEISLLNHADPFYVMPYPGGIYDEEIGIYHEVYSILDISVENMKFF